MRLALAALVIGLASAAHPLTPKLYPEVTLTGGEEQLVRNTGITLIVTEITDLRCPPEVDCFWQGMIRAEITVTGPASAEQIVLCNLCDDGSDLATAAGLPFGLVSLAPSTEELAKLGRDPLLADYQLTLNYGPAES